MTRLLWRLCKRGHERSPDNVSWSYGWHGKPQGKCKQCHLLTQRLYYRKKIDRINEAYQRRKANEPVRTAREDDQAPVSCVQQ